MRSLSVAPLLKDFTNKSVAIINHWFTQVTERFGLYDKVGSVAVADIPKNQWGLWRNDSTGLLKLVANDNGTIKSVNLIANPSVPVYEAHTTAVQAIPNAAFTKVVFDTESFDTDSYYDAANSKFLPLINGYYSITASIDMDFTVAPAAGNLIILSIYKNGVEAYRKILVLTALASNAYMLDIDAVLLLNGSTDFVEVFVFQNAGVAHNIVNGITTFTTGHLVRPV